MENVVALDDDGHSEIQNPIVPRAFASLSHSRSGKIEEELRVAIVKIEQGVVDRTVSTENGGIGTTTSRRAVVNEGVHVFVADGRYGRGRFAFLTRREGEEDNKNQN